MKIFLYAALLLTIYLPSFSQPFGNEWIDPSRTHYKITVGADGIYRIPYSTLAANIPNLGSLNPNNLILYHNGQPVPIFISATGSFGSSDYIEFYGKTNGGDMDSMLYRSSSLQPNPFISLFTGYSIYYLTTNNLQNNPRYTVVPNDLTNLPAKEDYFMYFNRSNYPCGQNFPGKYYLVGADETFKSTFDEGEGLTDCSYFGNSTPLNYAIATPFVHAQGPNATILTYYIANSPEPHNVVATLNNATTLFSKSNSFYALNRINTSVSPSQLLTIGSNTITFSETNPAAQSQTQDVVGAVGITYPREYNFGGASQFYFQVAASASKKYLEINGFNDNNTQPILYDITNGIIYKSVLPAGSSPVKFSILQSGVNREMYLRADAAFTYNTVSSLTPVNFIDYSNITNQGEYYIISNSALFNDGSGNNWVEQYRKYRDINENPGVGKYHNVRIADIDLLYDQFAYGIRKSPLAIRNFIRYGAGQWTDSMKYVFLIGKAREYETLSTAAANTQCLVPTFGMPASDNLLAATRQSDVPLVAVGRLAAQTGQQVSDYLNKIKLYEQAQNTYTYNQNIPDKIWQKRLLHFSGGTTSLEQSTFFNYLHSYGVIAKDTLWGGSITTFSKTSDQPIDQSVSQIIKNDINNGVSWITFFGHSATGAFDFSIDEPENYTNYGKYPIILSNGCFSGFIDDATPGYSERFVLEANKGAIAFMATSSVAVSSGLHDLSFRFYENFCDTTYTQSLGKSFQRTLTNLYNCCSAQDLDMETAYEMTLHGDPGMSINQYPKPDYAIDESSVFFTPTTVTAGTDSFTVSIVVSNLGRAIRDSIAVTLKRTINDAQGNPMPPYVYRQLVRAPLYVDTVSFKLPVNISTLGYGLNSFDPYVDADFHIDEMAEGNNGLTAPITINIQSDDIIPIYPYEFAIVPQQGVTLKASTINPFAPKRTYKFQVDTTRLFNSPLLQSGNVTQSGGVVHWKPTLTMNDSIVYYWRVSKDSVGSSWHNSSFEYITNEYPGWNQSHFFQWQQDTYLNLSVDSNTRIFKFPSTLNQIHVRTGRANAEGGNVDFETMGWDYNNANMYRFRMGGCGFNPGITFAVIDPVTGQNWISINANGDNFGDKFGNIHCSFQYYQQNGFDFPTTGTNTLYNQPWSQVIKRFIDSIPCNFYILIYSDNIVPYTQWDNTLITALQSIGLQSQLFTSSTVNGPFTYFTQKCNVNYNSFLDYTANFNTPLDTSFTFFGPWNQGNFTTPLIGPAESWNDVQWRRNPLNGQFTDKDTLDIIGQRVNGIDTILLSTTRNDNPVSFIDAKTYPYMMLRLRTRDDSLRTPTQPVYLRVLYKQPPEAAINPAAHFVISDTVNIGQTMHVEIALENVTGLPMDSMLTKYTLRDAGLNSHTYYVRQGPLTPLDTMILKFDAPISTAAFQGLDNLTIEANPNNDQPEQYHFNNIAQVGFRGNGDLINPLLDVTFDNQHIMNNDIVSAKPDILITLKDENKYLPLNDTGLVSVYLQYMGTSPTTSTTNAVPQRINYDGTILKFYPADSTNLTHSNKAQLDYKPTFSTDGYYELLIKDKDRSGNNSSTTIDRYAGNLFFDYKIDFEVINKPMVTNVLNYPNPFTTSTKFIFTITGSEIPDNMKIQIMTIKGTIVKEITKDELGPLHIGTNISEYAWDGRDQYGSPVANGVYFYRVSTRMDNKQMDHLTESYDKYFKKGFGKMVIIR